LTENAIKKTVLESYEVSEFKMVGVLTGPHQTRAMILDPTGASHFVGLNAKIGTHDGKVIQIFGDRIRVREKIENYSGRTENIDTDILLQSEGKLAQDLGQGSQSGR
jgi:Tfp pilus assembly protein PilP